MKQVFFQTKEKCAVDFDRKVLIAFTLFSLLLVESFWN